MHRHLLVNSLAALWLLTLMSPAQAAPVITSPPPANGVSPSAPRVFTFSEAMNTELTGVDFLDFTTFTMLPAIAVWSGGNTILTCTPSPTFPANRTVVWSAYGENLAGEPLGDPTGGIFTTGNGSGTTGSGTNAITTFSVGKVHHYNQISSGASTLDPATPYDFSAVTSLSSNRTATNIVLTFPTAAVSNMVQLPLQPEKYIIYGTSTSLNSYDATYPAGNYSFQVRAISSNQTAAVNLPTTNTMPQPPAPHLTNYAAAQAIDANQVFVLGWDAFPGGTAADYIDVDVGTGFGSADPGMPGALNGTARIFSIPAGTLHPNSNYLSRIGFFHYIGATNGNYTTAAFRATYTEFTLRTTGGSLLVLTNPSWTPGVFAFDVLCTNGQTVTVEYAGALTAVNWTKLLTTNSPGSQFHLISTQAASRPFLFYRARNGP